MCKELQAAHVVGANVDFAVDQGQGLSVEAFYMSGQIIKQPWCVTDCPAET